MAEITAALVKDLREKTGAGMMDAKNALVESGGDVEAAVDWLRKKGLAKAAKKSGRTAADGLVAIHLAGTQAAIIEVNSETDFVARNQEFQDFVAETSRIALGAKDAAELMTRTLPGGKTVADTLTGLVAKIGENMTLRRAASLQIGQGLVAGYVHGALNENAGRICALVALESSAPAEKLTAAGKQLAVHVAAANPQFLDSASVDPSVLEREKAILREQAAASGKPAEIVEKMMEGRVRKFYEDVCLVDQVLVTDGETRISDYLEKTGKEAGAPAALKAFLRFQLGEGIEKEADDFAAEVAKVANG